MHLLDYAVMLQRKTRKVVLDFDSELYQTNESKISIHIFPAGRSVVRGQCEEQAGKFTCVVGERLSIFSSHPPDTAGGATQFTLVAAQ